MADSKPKRIWGFLANKKLMSVAAADDRLTELELRAFVFLAGHADHNGLCCVALTTIARYLGTYRQSVQRALKHVEDCGYFSAERHNGWDGGEGAKIFRLNHELHGAMACPFRFDRPDLDVKPKRKSARASANQRTKPAKRIGVHRPDVAEGATSECCAPSNGQMLQPQQHPDVAHKRSLKDIREKNIKHNCQSHDRPVATGDHAQASKHQRTGNAAGQQGTPSARQRTILASIDDGRAELLERMNAYELESKRDAAARLYRDWSILDPNLSLLNLLERGTDRIWHKAIEIEAERPGQGKRYVARALEHATKKVIMAADILAGRYWHDSMS